MVGRRLQVMFTKRLRYERKKCKYAKYTNKSWGNRSVLTINTKRQIAASGKKAKMNINTKSIGAGAVFEILDGRIDASSAIEFKDHICGVIDEGKHEIVLDLSRVDFIDSSGIGAIVGVFKHLGRRGTFAVAGLTRSVERVFQLTRMDKVFRVYPSVDEALGSH